MERSYAGGDLRLRVTRVASAEEKRHAAKIVRQLTTSYPEAVCALQFQNPLELLIATILSAQCTDRRVNEVTQDLFRKYRAAADYAAAPLEELEEAIHSTGFFRNKAKNIQACCRALSERYGGQVPQDLETLVQLPGIGRKTANVVLGTAYGLSTGVVVDTHVSRLARRMGLSAEKDPEKIERDLMERIPRAEWIGFSHRMILHGRGVCAARKPQCEKCSLANICPRIGLGDSS